MRKVLKRLSAEYGTGDTMLNNIGALLMVPLVIGAGGLALVGLTDTPEPTVYGRFEVIAWDQDGDGAAEGARLDVNHIAPDRARITLSMNGDEWNRVVERGSQVFLPCPQGDRWLVITSGGNVVGEKRVPPCVDGGWYGDSGSPLVPPTEGSGDEEGWCPDGHEYVNGFVCVPIQSLIDEGNLHNAYIGQRLE